MSITLITINQLDDRAKTLVQAFVSWSTSKGISLPPAETTNIRLRAYLTNVEALTTESAAIVASTGYSSLDVDLRTDIETIQSTLVDVITSASELTAPDAHFAALSSYRQDEIAAEHGPWDDIPDDLKPDILQHDVVDDATISSIVASVTIA